jgi:outer membrane protein
VLTKEDVLRAEVQVAEVRQLLTRARSSVLVTIAGLNRAIGLDVSAPTEVVDRRDEPSVTLCLEEALNLAQANRREIEVVRRGIADANLDVKLARANYLPTLSIQAAVANVTGKAVQNADVLSGGTFAVLDVYTGGKRRGQERTARAGVSRAAAQAKQVVDGVAYEVHYAHAAVDDARERVAQGRTTVNQALENLRMVDNRYKSGDAQPTDVIDAQTTRTRADQDLSAALYQYQTAVARLEYALGVPVAGPPAAAPEGAAIPPPATTPSPFERPETPTPSEGTRSSPLRIPSLLPPLGGSDLFPTLAPPTTIQPVTPGPSSTGPATPGTPGIARPPYVSQPPGRFP